jgi:hypothetical protein
LHQGRLARPDAKTLRRGLIAEETVRTYIVVVVPPRFTFMQGVSQAQEPVGIEALRPTAGARARCGCTRL